MKHRSLQTMTVRSLQEEMGKSLASWIDRWGERGRFADEAGINRTTLYRLLKGENTGTDTLLRVLRTLGRLDLVASLLEEAAETPMEKLKPPLYSDQAAEAPVFGDLKLGKPQ